MAKTKKTKQVVRYMRQLYDNWLVFQQEQLAVHGWMARSGWPGEWAEAWAAAVGRCQEMLTSPPSLTIGPFSFLSIFQSNIQGLCHWNPTPCSLVGPILLPLETPPLVFIVCAATPCLRLVWFGLAWIAQKRIAKISAVLSISDQLPLYRFWSPNLNYSAW